jgi:hypothetical protein
MDTQPIDNAENHNDKWLSDEELQAMLQEHCNAKQEVDPIDWTGEGVP